MVDRKRFVRRTALPLMTLACAMGSMLLTLPGQSFAANAAQEQKASPKKTKEELLSPENVAKISQAYGHFIAKSLDNPLLKLNFDAVVQGMNDQRNGKASPLTEQEYEEAITQLQELSFQETSQKNLQEAEQFLKENAKKSGVQVLEDGKLQILVEKAGDGTDVVTESVMPVIHYTGSYLNGTVFGSSKDSKEPLSISLNQTIPGFKKGVLGMKVGEKRRIFIHPDLGYGTSGQLMPNALLVFDIELVKIDPLPQDQNVDSDDDDDINFDTAMADEDDVEGSMDDDQSDADQDIDFDTADGGRSSYNS